MKGVKLLYLEQTLEKKIISDLKVSGYNNFILQLKVLLRRCFIDHEKYGYAGM